MAEETRLYIAVACSCLIFCVIGLHVVEKKRRSEHAIRGAKMFEFDRASIILLCRQNDEISCTNSL